MGRRTDNTYMFGGKISIEHVWVALAAPASSIVILPAEKFPATDGVPVKTTELPFAVAVRPVGNPD
jgi:hypothetical protein